MSLSLILLEIIYQPFSIISSVSPKLYPHSISIVCCTLLETLPESKQNLIMLTSLPKGFKFKNVYSTICMLQ